MFLPSSPLGRWWKTLPTIFSRIWLVRPRYHAKYSMTIYHNITGILITMTCRVYPKAAYITWFGITLSTFYVYFNTIFMWLHVWCQCVTPPPHDYRYMNILRLSYAHFYNNFKVTNIGIFRTPFLTRHLFWKVVACCEEMMSS